jgi:hypothetical protein
VRSTTQPARPAPRPSRRLVTVDDRSTGVPNPLTKQRHPPAAPAYEHRTLLSSAVRSFARELRSTVHGCVELPPLPDPVVHLPVQAGARWPSTTAPASTTSASMLTPRPPPPRLPPQPGVSSPVLLHLGSFLAQSFLLHLGVPTGPVLLWRAVLLLADLDAWLRNFEA